MAAAMPLHGDPTGAGRANDGIARAAPRHGAACSARDRPRPPKRTRPPGRSQIVSAPASPRPEHRTRSRPDGAHGQSRHRAAVVDAGTVPRAAAAPFLSQSSVTKNIQQLEQSVGARLLQQTRRSGAPTAAGRARVARAKAIDRELRETRNDIDSQLGMRPCHIRIAASPTVGTSFLPRTVLPFIVPQPRVTPRLHEGRYADVRQSVRRGKLALAVCLVGDGAEHDTVSFEILLRGRPIQALRIGHPLERRSAPMTGLQRCDRAVHRRGRSRHDVFERAFTAAGLALPTSAFEGFAGSCRWALIERGDCVTRLPSQLLADPAPRRRLSAVPMQTEIRARDGVMSLHSQHEVSAVCRVNLEELRNVARRIGANGVAHV